MADGGATFTTLTNNSTDLTIAVAGGDISFSDENLATTGNATVGGTLGVTGASTLSDTLAVSGNTTIGGTLGVTGAVTADAGVTVDTLTIDGSTIASTGAIILDATTDVTLDADGALFRFYLVFF